MSESVLKRYDFRKCMAIYNDLHSERSEWEREYRQVSEFLLPGRGIYQTYAKPRKRKLTSPRVINSVAEDALYILTSGLHGRLTSPAMPWFKLGWADQKIRQIEALKAWLQDCEGLLHSALHASNFYTLINSFYVEYAGFGTGSIYVGEDTNDVHIPFKFELLTAGEFLFSLGADGLPALYIRTIFMSPRQLFEAFPKTASDSIKMAVDENRSGIDKVELAVLEIVVKEKYQDKPITQIYYEVSGNSLEMPLTSDKGPLQVKGFYEWPYPTGRWGTIGSDVYGIGPGSRALPDVKRLQEMEKAFLMATHKSINPPLNVPSRMRGKLNTLPGGHNFYANPNETVNELYQVRFDYQGVSSAIERVEQRIQRNFFNDVFLTAMRDPNASPLKAAQVMKQDQEATFRLGPIVERLGSEVFNPTIKRCFNIMKRKDMLPPLDPSLEEIAGDFEVQFVSPLFTAQRAVRGQSTDAFMGFIGQAAQFDEKILDNIDIDEAARQRADIEGVQYGVVRTQEQVEELRAERAAAQAAAAEQEQQAAMAGAQLEAGNMDAQTRKMNAETGQILAETQTESIESGILQ